jgi:hypothetical protein
MTGCARPGAVIAIMTECRFREDSPPLSWFSCVKLSMCMSAYGSGCNDLCSSRTRDPRYCCRYGPGTLSSHSSGADVIAYGRRLSRSRKTFESAVLDPVRAAAEERQRAARDAATRPAGNPPLAPLFAAKGRRQRRGWWRGRGPRAQRPGHGMSGFFSPGLPGRTP